MRVTDAEAKVGLSCCHRGGTAMHLAFASRCGIGPPNELLRPAASGIVGSLIGLRDPCGVGDAGFPK